MANNTLEEIVAVEQEIQAHLAEEHRKAAVWLAAERAGITRDTEAELAEARQQCRQQIADSEAEAGDGVGELVPRAEAYAARLKSLPEERLQTQILGHLHQLLPEQRP
jgi:F0F1-type ATP synthase membrane subunit b/b'